MTNQTSNGMPPSNLPGVPNEPPTPPNKVTPPSALTSTPVPPPVQKPITSPKTVMTKKEEITLALVITLCVVVAIWGIVWATRQGGSPAVTTSSTQQKSQTSQASQDQILQAEQSNSAIGGPTVLDEAWTRFADPGLRFTIDGPDAARFITDSVSMASVGYQPTCNPDTGIVCVYLPDSTFPKSNFNGAGVSVNTTTDSASSCLATKNGEVASPTQKIIGTIPFASFTSSDAAMSHQSAGNDYRTFRNGTCYEITTRINTTTFEVYTKGSIAKFTDQERTTISLILEKIVSSFRFLK